MKIFLMIAGLVLAISATATDARAQLEVPPLPLLFSETGPGVRIAEAQFAAPADVVWEVLPAVLADLGIEPQVDTTMEGVMGNVRILTPVVGGERSRHYVSCGTDVGPGSANIFRIRLNLVVHVRPEGTGTRTYTRLSGTGNTVQGSGGDGVYCITTGRLEQRIADGITGYLARLGALGQSTGAVSVQ